MKRILALLLVIAFLVTGATFVSAKNLDSGTRGNPTGRNISGLNTKNLANTVTYTGSIFQEAKVTILNYWGTWCGVCTSEMPQVKQFYQYLQSNPSYNVKLYGVVSQGNESSAQSYLNNNGYNWPNMRTDSVLQSAFYGGTSNSGDGSAPQWAAVDCNGNIIKYLNQSVTYSSLKSFADQALAIAPDNGGGNPTPSPTPGGDGSSGTYSGTATVQGYNYTVTVSVTKNNGTITNVNVTGNNVGNNQSYLNRAINGYGSTAGIPTQIVNKQGTSNIDTVSGATRTCNAIVQGANTALANFSSNTPTPAPTATPTPTPTPINAPTLTVSIVNGKPSLVWNSVSGASRYRVKRATGSGNYTTIATITNTSYTDNASLNQGQTYSYMVCGVSSNGTEGNCSAPQSITIPYQLTAPTVSVHLENGKPVLSWNSVNGAAVYQIKRAMGSGSYGIIANITGTSYTDEDFLESGQTYYYTVCAFAANNSDGACSAPVSITIPNQLEAPVVSVSLSEGKPVLTWNAVNGAAVYVVKRSMEGDGDYRDYDYIASVYTTTYTDNDYLVEGETYSYVVCAYDQNGLAGVCSAPVSITIQNQLDAPVVSVSLVDGKPVLTWNAVNGAAVYVVKRSMEGDGDYRDYDYIASVYTTTYTDNDYLIEGETYSYVVCAYDQNGLAGVCSAPVSITIQNQLEAPSLTVSLVGGKPVLEWNAVSGAAIYAIKRAHGDGDFVFVNSSYSTSYTDYDYLIGGETYSYVVCAYDQDGIVGICCAPVSITLDSQLAAPSVSVSIVNGKPVLSWNAVSGAASYQIKRAQGSGSFSLINTVSGTTYADSAALAPGETYSYTVCAYAANGAEGVCSAPVSITIPSASLSAPTLSVMTFGSGKPKLTWNSVSGAARYKINRSSDGVNFGIIAAVSNTKYIDSAALIPGHTYYYTVCAYGSNGEQGACSAVVSITIPGGMRPFQYEV